MSKIKNMLGRCIVKLASEAGYSLLKSVGTTAKAYGPSIAQKFGGGPPPGSKTSMNTGYSNEIHSFGKGMFG